MAKKGFSFIEISVIILIIGIFIAGISTSSYIYKKYQLKIANNKTANSPINSISGLVLWLEATTEESFDEISKQDYNSLSAAEQNNGSGSVMNWYNIGQASGIKINLTSAAANAPQFKSDCINNLPCVYFNGNNHFLQFSKLPLVGKNYTIFIVEKSELNTQSAPLISAASITGSNNYIQLANNNNSSIFFSTDATENISYNFSDSPYNKALVHTISSNYEDYYYYTIPSSGSILMYQYLYENNNEEQTFPPTSATDGNFYSFYSDYLTSALSSNPHYLGYGQVRSSSGSVSTGYFHGGIGELIIFNKRLNAQERKRIQEYLIKKWGITGSPQYNVSGSGGNQIVN